MNSVVVPGKVFRPGLAARVKERHETFAYRVERVCFDVFVVVTALASEREIVQLVCTALVARDDVFKGESVRGNLRRAAAIFAQAVRPRFDLLPEARRGAYSTHCGA